MKQLKVKKFFRTSIEKWYLENSRDLPWRKTKNPYKIWLSEIILQQTRVTQGLDYYHRFVERWPTVADLATASEDDVLKEWQGLGYYSRARNLHATAKYIANECYGNFPEWYEEILKLKGVGKYTAAAISSFAFSLPYATVDGNVYRVLSRFFAESVAIDTKEGEKYFFELANRLLDKENPALYNQAIMDFGALQCVPKNPKCADCVLSANCVAYKIGNVEQFPTKKNKVNQRNRYLNYFYIEENGFVYFRKRSKNDIWKNLYEFPMIETLQPCDFLEIKNNEAYLELMKNQTEIEFISDSISFTHKLSHQILYAKCYYIKVHSKIELQDCLRIDKKDLDKYPVPKLIEKFFLKISC